MRVIIPVLFLSALLLAGCEERQRFDADKAFEQLTAEQKESVLTKWFSESGEQAKWQAKIDAAHRLDSTANLCVLLIVGGIIAGWLCGSKKIGVACVVGGAAGITSILYWQNAQLLILEYSRTSYIIGVCLLAILVVAGIYALFNKTKGEAVVREGSLLDKLAKKITGKSKEVPV